MMLRVNRLRKTVNVCLTAFGMLWISPLARTNASPESDFGAAVSGKYVLNNSCPGGTESGECADLTVVKIQVSIYQMVGHVERASSGLKRNGHSSFQKFYGSFAEEGPVSGRAFTGHIVVTFPATGNCDAKTLRQPIGAKGRFVEEDGKKVLEVEYDYQALDSTTCSLGGPTKPTKERWHRIGD